MEKIEVFGGLLVLGLCGWWYFHTAAPDLPIPAAAARALHLQHVHRASVPAVAATRVDSADEEDRQRRLALQQQTFRQIEERDAAYQRAMDKYNTERTQLEGQISSLSASNQHGANNGQIEALEQQLHSLSLPQR